MAHLVVLYFYGDGRNVKFSKFKQEEKLKSCGPVAQLVEQRFALREVVSSTLAGPTLRVLK